MELKSIKLSEAFESKTNPRGNKFEGPEFDDLVASVKENGVLVPVIARLSNVEGGVHAKIYEIVAGNRRFRAAQLAGLKDIPARIELLTDDQAREIQIIENLQRADVHPLEEGASYRKLVEKSHYEISSVAAKVGKSESYIRQRLFLTNLVEKPAAAYRSGKITDGHAVLIAKLSAGDQLDALKEATGGWELMSVKNLKEWIEDKIYSPISRQPWLGKKELEEVVGPCIECKPVSATLFGEVKIGACNNLKCWRRKMDAYINYRAKKDKMAKVADGYGYGPDVPKGVLHQGDYVVIEKKSKRCDSIRPAIIAHGKGIGKEIKEICSNPKCDIHHGSRSGYERTPEEKAARKKEREKAAKEKVQRNDNLKAILAKIEWPLSDEYFEALLELAFNQAGFNSCRRICKRHEIKVEKKVDKKYNYASYHYTEELKKAAAAMDKTQKIRLIFELIIDTGDYLRETESLGKF